MQKTLVLIKPDGVKLKIMGEIITAIEKLNLTISQIKLLTLSKSEAELLYEEHKDQWFFERNINHVISGDSVAIEVQGNNSVEVCRHIVASIRAKYSNHIELPKNLIHSTSNAENAEHEIKAVGF